MSDLGNSWKETGKGLGNAFAGLGKSLIKTGAHALNKANEWANGDEKQEKEEKEE